MNYDKGRAREPRPFFLPLEGLVLGSQWLKIFMSTLPDDLGGIPKLHFFFPNLV